MENENNNYIMAHADHCCKEHGCKYGVEDCPVVLGSTESTADCEICEMDFEDDIDSSGFVIDCGYTIDGPFIPDGTIRVYDPETLEVLGEGETTREAMRDFYRRSQD